MGRYLSTASPVSTRRLQTEQHCRRVAGWACELARAAGFDVQSRELLRACALAHHYPAVLLDPCARPRLLADLCLLESPGAVPLPAGVAEVLSRMHCRHSGDNIASRLAMVLELANALDEWIESEPLCSPDDDPAPAGLAAQAAVVLRVVDDGAVNQLLRDLPVVPRVAQQVLTALQSENWNASRIEALASSEPVLAGHLIQCANTCAFGARQPIASISRAVLQIGETAAKRVLAAACLRPAFASPPLYRLWNHSLAVADVAQQLAERSSMCDPSEAFLSGLVHDIGRVAMFRLGDEFQTRLAVLLEASCDTVSAERVLCGMSHAGIGALITEQWRFPARLTEAVRNHHRPECGDRMAAILFLAEECTRSDESPLCTLRQHLALDASHLTAQDLESVEAGKSTDLTALRFAA